MMQINKVIACLVACALLNSSLQAQQKLPAIYLNHLSIALDSLTYSHLFESAFLTKNFADADSTATATTTDSWSGKYLEGKNGYFEFFSTGGYKNASVGDLGIGLICLRSGGIWEIQKNWHNKTNDSIKVDTTIYVSNGKKEPWFYSISLYRPDDSIEKFSTWLMENTPEDLLGRGFSRQEIQKEIPWQEYKERHSHKPYSKLFDRITALRIMITKEEFLYLKKSLLGFGMQEKRNTFFNHDIKIAYTIDPSPIMRIRSIEAQLTGSAQGQELTISDRVHVRIKGKKAIWEFH